MEKLVGFRFLPTDHDIIRHLENKRLDPDYSVHTITEANIYQFEPFELPGLSPIQADENWCNFFCEPDYINADRDRVRRTTKTGYWKPTGKPKEITAKCSSEVIGKRRILLFYEDGQGSRDIKTDWVMHQFSINDNSLYEKDFFLCRIKRNKDKKARRNSTNIEGQRHNKKLRTSTIDEENISPTSQLLPSNYSISSSRNHVAEDTSPEIQLPSRLLPSNYTISNSRNHIEKDIFPKSQLLPSNNMISNSRNHVAKNISPESQILLQSLPSNNSISNSRNQVAENISLLLQLLQSNNSISNSRNHVAENTFSLLHLLSQLIPSNDPISNSRNHIVENTSPESQLLSSESQLLSQLLQSNNSISNSRNHITENTSPEPQLLSPESQLLSQLLQSNNSISNSRNHIAENTSPESQLLSPESQLLSQLLPSNNSISNSRNHVAENTYPESQLLSPESQLLRSNNSISNYRNHVAENISPKLQLVQLLLQLLSQLLSSNNLVSDFINYQELQLLLSNYLISSGNHVAENTLNPMIFDAVNGCNGLDQTSFSAMQLSINPEQGSSYCSVSSNDYDVLNYTLGSEDGGGVVNPQWVIRDEYPSEGTGHDNLPLDFNSSKPVEGFCGGDSSDTDTNSVNEWVNEILVYDTPQV